MEELWKPVKWYEGLYEINTIWKVKSLWYLPYVGSRWRITKGKTPIILKPLKDTHWYLFHILSNFKKEKRHLRINRIVAQAFLWLDISNPKVFVCHRDDNPMNNSVENLFLWTAKENMEDKVRKWRSANAKWENNPRSKLSNGDIYNILRLISIKIPQRDIARVYWVQQSTICSINKWRLWSHLSWIKWTL